jgi:gluconate 2-dehydrogenase gamma chain
MSSKQSSERLNETEVRILEHVAERIFPKTDTPGALECGAVDYIQAALDGAYAGCLPLYREGLGAVDRHAQRRFGVAFTTLEGGQQDSVLADFEAGNVNDFSSAAEFFETVRYHVLEGVFCEPHYGGNKDMLGWRLVNFPGQQFGYPDPYINKEVDLPPVAVDYRKAEKD